MFGQTPTSHDTINRLGAGGLSLFSGAHRQQLLTGLLHMQQNLPMLCDYVLEQVISVRCSNNLKQSPLLCWVSSDREGPGLLLAAVR